MGRDKSLIRVDGIPMAERVARVLESAGCDPVVFVGGDRAALEVLGRRFVPDRWPGEGPVGGVITSLSALGGFGPVVVCACDLQDLTTAAVSDLVGDGPMTADVRVADSGRVEPLLACWGPGAAAKIVEQFDRGVRAMHDVLASLAVERVSVDRAAVRNVNKPGDLGD